MDDLPSIMRDIVRIHENSVSSSISIELLEAYCKRYIMHYHLHVESQPRLFYGAWGWTEARRREFRKAFDATGLKGQRPGGTNPASAGSASKQSPMPPSKKPA